MKLRLPLLAKILGWFLLNLVLLAGLGFLFLRLQFRIGLDSLLADSAVQRVAGVGDAIAFDLRELPPADWTGLLQSYDQSYGVRFSLVRPDGSPVAGAPLRVPLPVRQRLQAFRPEPPPFLGRPPPERAAPLPGRPPRRTGPGFMMRSNRPTQYWVGVPLPTFGPEPGERRPLILLVASESLGAGGLFLDYKPWLILGLVALGVSVLFWLPLIRGITRSIAQMTQATEQISEGRFDVRVDEQRRDELGWLGQAINRMSGRLDGLVTGQKRFLGDVAHELCSPLARIQVAIGVLEQRAHSEHQSQIQDVREEAEQMADLVNELLSFSRASLRAGDIPVQPVVLVEVVRAVVRREAEDNDRIEIAVPAELRALAEPDLLARALANLIRNALRYAGAAGPIRIAARAADDQIVITVADSGPGVPAEMLSQLFDPFFRVEASRSRDSGGVGLGLAIVKTCVEACRGTVTARNREPNGLAVCLRLPAAD